METVRGLPPRQSHQTNDPPQFGTFSVQLVAFPFISRYLITTSGYILLLFPTSRSLRLRFSYFLLVFLLVFFTASVQFPRVSPFFLDAYRNVKYNRATFCTFPLKPYCQISICVYFPRIFEFVQFLYLLNTIVVYSSTIQYISSTIVLLINFKIVLQSRPTVIQFFCFTLTTL